MATAISDRRPVVSDRLITTVFEVRCDHPSGEPIKEFGRNVFWLTGPTAETDARIIAAELLVRGWKNIVIRRQQHRKVRRAGEPQCRDRYVWSDVAL